MQPKLRLHFTARGVLEVVHITLYLMSVLWRLSRVFFSPCHCSVLSRSASQLWSEDVGPRGTLKVDWRSGRNVDIHVRSVDVSKTVEGNRAEVSLKGGDPDDYEVSVRYEKDDSDIVISGTSSMSTVGQDHSGDMPVLSVELPPQFNVSVSAASHTGVSINDMECDLVDINLENGSTLLNRLKVSTCSVSTTSGSIKTNTYIQGSLNLVTESGSLDLVRVQGSNLSVKTSSGLISMESVYFKKSSVMTRTGLVSLGALHGTAAVSTQTGDIDIQTLDGSLRALSESGDIDIHVARCRSIHIESSQGSVNLKLGDDVRLANRQLTVSAAQGLDIAPDVCDDAVSTDCDIKVAAKEGSVTIQRQSWLDSLNLKMKIGK